MTLRISNLASEGVYQGSKYLKYQVLCDIEELKELFFLLHPFLIYPLTGLVEGSALDPEYFIEVYKGWIEGLKKGKIPQDQEIKKILAAAFTKEATALWRQEVPGGRYIIKPCAPVVQVQAHFFSYSPIDGVFRSMTLSSESIFWGLQFSFPQIYQEPKTMELKEGEEALNMELFQKIKHWVRNQTRPTPFVVEGKKINVPIRLGKQCFSWIFNHPGLIQQQIGIYGD